MSIFETAKKNMAAIRQPKTTVIQVEKYVLDKDKDPKKSYILGRDLLNKDENGVPKQVKVFVHDPEGKVMGVKEFASQSSLVNTSVGGLIRLDRFVLRGDDYVCKHMQRLARDRSLLRQDESGAEYKAAFAQAWTKVLPQMDRATGKPQVYETKAGKINRATAFMVPKDAKPMEITLGDGTLLDQLTAAATRAIEEAPEKTRPMVLLRDPTGTDAIEVVIPHSIERAEGKRELRTKEEMLEVFPELDKVKSFIAGNRKDLAGITVEAVPGYSMGVYGTIEDPRSGKPIEGRVASMARETCRMFAKPVEGQDRPQMIPGHQEYALGLLSYEIPQAAEVLSANLITLGRVPGVTCSPNASERTTPNPFYGNRPSTEQESAPAQSAQAPVEQPAATTQSAPTESTPAAAQGGPEEPPMPTDEDIDSILSEADLGDADFDMDEIERQMSSQGM